MNSTSPVSCRTAQWTRFSAGCLALLFSLIAGEVARAESRSIEDFLKVRDRWNELVGTRWTLEGRYSGISDGRLMFAQCPLPFQLPPGAPRPRSDSPVVEVTGVLELVDRKLQFRVESMRSRSSDLESIRLKRGEIDSNDPQAWYRVADWARERGTFYKDPALIEAAADLDLNGLQTELRRAPPDDTDVLARLLQKAEQKQAPAPLKRSIAHQGLWARMQHFRTRQASDNDYRDLLVAAAKSLPASTRPLPEFPQELAQEYYANPGRVYAAADDVRRQQLERLLYLQAVVERIELAAKRESLSGFDLAARLKTDAPERRDLIEQMENDAIAAQRAKVPQMTRAQLLELCQLVQDRGRPELVDVIKRDWLKAREPLLRKDGPRGLTELGDHWESLLGDREAAAEFYQAAWRLNPDYPPALDWLSVRGYTRQGDRWTLAEEAPPRPKTAIDRALEQGRVLPGMTPDQVRTALGGDPTRRTRFASSGRIADLWIYESSGVAIRFERRPGLASDRVVAVEPLQPPAPPPMAAPPRKKR